jgi:hypothetical protein
MGKAHTSPERERRDRHIAWYGVACGIRSPGLRRGLLWGRPIQALSVSDGIGTSLGAASHVASDPPAYAEGFYENASPNDLRQAAAVAGRS